eukprot:TRINITY_DN15335_c2_g2_i1.p1 TRINITY_DN15335_c2_g2~~TRINITY_DN15335_c2_g2_i1.p1  ORF type:complete len:355 (+),score=53.78 TRINITY_DN15335_c2_g2_i1:56-1120(+)
MLAALLCSIVSAATGANELPYTRLGVYDVNVFETTLSYWRKEDRLVLLESIPCAYWGHVGQWESIYAGHSYFRMRDYLTGEVISNIETSIGMGFGNGFVDYDHETYWVFGTPLDRCGNQSRPFGPPANETLHGVYAWSSKDLINWTRFKTDANWNGPNVDVGRVYPSKYQLSSPLPEHKYVMATEHGEWLINNNPTGNLATGWQLLDNSTFKGGVEACPSVRYLPSDGYYYTVSGGVRVVLQRSRDLQTWERASVDFLAPDANDSHVPNVVNGVGNIKMQPGAENSLRNLNKWDNDTNDADLCCENWGGASKINQSYLVYGVSDQGSRRWPDPAAFSGLSKANMTLEKLLQSFF